MLFIGDVEIKGKAALAPMASVADHAFRELCKKFGASYVVGEMASSKGLTMSDRKTKELLSVTEYERPMGVQIFGDDPYTMAKAAYKCLEFLPDIIDINMGCPAPKVAGNGGGSALMKSPGLAGEIVREVSGAVNVPVTVKFRKGWDDENVNAVEFAKIMEANGASALTVHGRTRTQMYSGEVDKEIIKAVKQAVGVPVIASGDVIDGISAREMYDITNADLVMIGRGAYGSPWVFSEVSHYLETGMSFDEPDIFQRLCIMKEHVLLICKYKGESLGMREARKHCAWYMKGIKGAAGYRRMMGTLCTFGDLERVIDMILCDYV